MRTVEGTIGSEMTHSTMDVLKDKRCLVTGGAGFIGSHLTRALLEAGSEVRVLDNLSTGFHQNLEGLDSAQFEFINGDASDRETVERSMSGVNYVFHQAAMASVPRSIREPALCHAWCATSTVELLRAASTAGVERLVLASTSAAYGDSRFVSKRECDPVAPLSPYAAAKLSAESYCRAFMTSFGMETVILRYFNVFGPRQDPQSEYSAVIPRFVSMILSGKQPIIYGDGQQSRDFVYVGDVARANMLAATTEGISGRTFNIGRGERTSLLELLNQLSHILGKTIDPIHEPARVGDIRDSLADINQARNDLGFDPEVSIYEGLSRSVDYYRSIV